MTLSRLVTYTDGNTLTGAQLNAEFDNILNNGPSLISLTIPAYSAVSGLNGSISTAGIGSFSANAYQLKSTSVICSLSATSSYSINTQTAGPIANGRDQAAVFASTQVHFYAITTGGTSTNAAGICSTKPPNIGPTLPAGYTAWAYLTSITYSTLSSAPAIPTFVTGSRVYARTPQSLLTAGGALVETDVACGATVPNTAQDFTISIANSGGITPSSGGSLSIAHFFYTEPAVVSYSYSIQLPSTQASGTLNGGLYHITFPNVRTTPTFGYSNNITAGTSSHISAGLVSYRCPNGDVG